MTLTEFHRYLQEKVGELDACHKELEEVQTRFNEIFRDALEVWKAKFSYCLMGILEQRQELPSAFARRIDEAERVELARIQQEIVDLGNGIEAERARADELMAQGQAETEGLRGASPDLSAQEAELKARMVQFQDEYSNAYEQEERLNSGMGWITNLFRVRRLKSEQHRAKKQQAEVLEQLRNLRTDWLERVQNVAEHQAELRRQWQEATVNISEAQARRDHLMANTEALGQQGAVEKILMALNEDVGVPGELGDALRELVTHNRTRRSYESGLRAVAEALGITKGVREGMSRFSESVGSVVAEQRRHGLRDVRVILAPGVINANDTWAALAARVRDETRLGKNPAEFVQVVQQYLTSRLPDTVIQQTFESMGESLSRATSQWG